MPQSVQLAREYELIYILKPNVGPSEARKVSDRIVDVAQKQGAKLTRVDNWGKRRLAYPIDRHTRGVFIYVKLIGFNEVVAELERNLRILDDVVRYQTIRLGEVHDLTEVAIDPEEIAFRDIETSEEEDEDPSFEERLGMRGRSRDRDRDRDRDEDGDSDDDDEDDRPRRPRARAADAAATEAPAEAKADTGAEPEDDDSEDSSEEDA